MPPSARNGANGIPILRALLPWRTSRTTDGTRAAIIPTINATGSVTYLSSSSVVKYTAPNTTTIAVRFVLRDATEPPATDSNRTPLHPKELEKADATTLEIGREIFQLERERDDLEATIAQIRKRAEVGLKDPADIKPLETRLAATTRRIGELKKMMSETSTKPGGRSVIDTSFQMTDGETVVVGTSKVKGGGKALIALLTATTDRKVSTK